MSSDQRPSRPRPVHRAASRAGIASLEGLEGRRLLAVTPPDHIVLVVEENRVYDSIINDTRMPYLSSLAAQGAVFTDSHGLYHPSQPNYLSLFSGSNQGVVDNLGPYDFVGVPNVASELIAAGRSFVGYAQELPEVGSKVIQYGQYDRRHNPWVDFDNVPDASNRPFDDFPSDFTTLPTVSFVVPDENHNGHDLSLEIADQFLHDNLGAYAAWAKTHNSLLIVTWDENDSSEPTNHVATVMYGANVVPGQYNDTVSHYDVLRTMTDFYGLAPLANTAAVRGIDYQHLASKPDLAAASDTGGDDQDEVTRDTTPTFTGTATPGSTVKILSDDVVVGSAAAAADGAYAITASPLAAGAHAIRAAIDANGDAINRTAALTVTVDLTPPRVTQVVLDGRAASANVHRISLSFDGAVRVGLSDLSIRNDATGQSVPAAKFAMTYDGATNVATWTFPGLQYGMPANGNYTAKLSAAVTDVAGNALDGNADGAGGDAKAFAFFQLAGDANADRVVDRFDFHMIYVDQESVGANLAADFSNDGRVGFADLQIYELNFGKAVPAPAPAPLPASAAPARPAAPKPGLPALPKAKPVPAKVPLFARQTISPARAATRQHA